MTEFTGVLIETDFAKEDADRLCEVAAILGEGPTDIIRQCIHQFLGLHPVADCLNATCGRKFVLIGRLKSQYCSVRCADADRQRRLRARLRAIVKENGNERA